MLACRRLAFLLLSITLLACGDENELERAELFTGLWKLPSSSGAVVFLEFNQDGSVLWGNLYVESAGERGDPVPLINGAVFEDVASFDLDLSVLSADAPLLNASAVATRACSLVVHPGPLVIDTTLCPLPGGALGAEYPAVTMRASGGAPPYSWSASGLPPGLSIGESSGEISGTPAEVSTFAFTVTVSDSLGSADRLSCSIAIEPAGLLHRIFPGGRAPSNEERRELSARAPHHEAPVAASGIFPLERQYVPLVIEESMPACPLAEARVGTTYSAPAFRATGGVPPYAWSARGLPPGLSIDESTGEIGGTPRRFGTFDFEVIVLDAALIDSLHMVAVLMNPSFIGLRSTACVQDTCFSTLGLGERQQVGF